MVFVSDVGNAINCYDCYYKADSGDDNCLYVDESTNWSDCDNKTVDDLDACIVRAYFTSPYVYVHLAPSTRND